MDRKCKIGWCQYNNYYAKGLCRAHYEQMRRDKSVFEPKTVICSVENCVTQIFIRQRRMREPYLCEFHYMRHIGGRPLEKEKNYCYGTKTPYPRHNVFKKNRLIKLKQIGYKCEECSSKKKYLIAHHADFTKTNHDVNNLKILCCKCHYKIHH